MGKEKKEYAPTSEDIKAFKSVTISYMSDPYFKKIVHNLENPDNKEVLTKKEMESTLDKLHNKYLSFLDTTSNEENAAAMKVGYHLLKHYTSILMQRKENIENIYLRGKIYSIGEAHEDIDLNEMSQEDKNRILLEIEKKITKLDETQNNNNYYIIIIFLLILATFLIASALLTGSPFTAFSILGSWLK